MRHAVPQHARFTEAGAGGDQRAIADLARIGLRIQRKQFVWKQRIDAIGVGFEIVEQAHLLKTQLRL